MVIDVLPLEGGAAERVFPLAQAPLRPVYSDYSVSV
jgi:hypothetical protein